ncbi:hypothetical protein BH11BAC3_BH11BAC3_11770 [soil metagenome]
MKKIGFLLIVSFVSTIAVAQQKPVVLDINKIMKMNPQELAAYKQQLLKKNSQQAKAIAAQYNFKVDETLLPDFVLKPPVKDIKRLALLPVKPPSLIELSAALLQSKKQIENVATLAIVDEVKIITATETAAQQQSSAVAAFYSDQPVAALLIAIHAVLQNTSEPAAWNNLAALFNMSGLEQKAIPILMNQLEKMPGNPMLLNNMGQAYLGLGDLNNAEMFLQQCLLQDPMNPEANHSMGIMKFFANEIDEGMKYFEKELEIGYRRSTLALIKSKNKVANIYKLRKKRTNLPQKDFFGEIQLGKFNVPAFPQTTDDTKPALEKHVSYRESVAGELLYWLEKGNANPKILKAEGKHESVYSDRVEVLLHDLHEVYTPYELSLLNDIQFNYIKQLIDNYNQELNAIKCEEPKANATMAETIAL